MYPPPITAISFISLAFTYLLNLSISTTFLIVNTFTSSIPGILGTIGLAPGDNTSLS